MNKKIISTIVIFLAFGIFGATGIQAATTTQQPQTAKKQAQTTAAIKPINTTALNIVNNPQKYLNKTVKIQATFDKFSTLGLDYSKAMRPSTKYIGILIQRDDVINHNIPLSEMKLFLKKELAEKHIDLDTGDKIELTAKVFSTALNDPWLDVETLTVIKKNKQEETKN